MSTIIICLLVQLALVSPYLPYLLRSWILRQEVAKKSSVSKRRKKLTDTRKKCNTIGVDMRRGSEIMLLCIIFHIPKKKKKRRNISKLEGWIPCPKMNCVSSCNITTMLKIVFFFISSGGLDIEKKLEIKKTWNKYWKYRISATTSKIRNIARWICTIDKVTK